MAIFFLLCSRKVFTTGGSVAAKWRRRVELRDRVLRKKREWLSTEFS